MKNKIILMAASFMLLFACTTDDADELVNENGIFGQWALAQVNEIDVANVECYQDSYLRIGQGQIEFYILDRMQDGSCNLLVEATTGFEEIDGFYFVEDEAIEIYQEGNVLTWRVDFETTLTFERD